MKMLTMTNTTEELISTWILSLQSMVRGSISTGPVVRREHHSGTHVMATRRGKKEEKAVGKQGRPFKGTSPPPVNYFFQ